MVESGLAPWGNTSSDTSDIRQRMRHYRTPGVAVAVFDRGVLDWAAGYGVTTSGGSPVRADTVFQAASISKVVAALCALNLASIDMPPLDAPVNDWLFSWRFPPYPGMALRPVTLRMLLSHTGGVNVPGFPGYPREERIPTVSEVLRGVPPAVTPPVRVTTPPGGGFRYSGGGTLAVQRLLEDVTGRNFAELVRQYVLSPAQMVRSGFAPPLQNVALAHDAYGALVPGGWRYYPELAPAGLWSTAEDLARLGLAICEAASGLWRTPLDSDWSAVMLAPEYRAGNLAVGLGLFLKLGEERIAFHEGSNHGYKSLLLLLPERRSGLVVMTNAENGRGLILEILEAVARAYGWPGFPPADWSATGKGATRYAGSYETSDGGVLELVTDKKGGGLSLALFPGMTPLRLLPLPQLPDGAARFALPDPLDPLLLEIRGDELLVQRDLFPDIRARLATENVP